MGEDDFSVIIVTYNSEAYILDLLTEIGLFDPGALPRTVVVDNHSTDATVSLIRSNFPQAVLIPNETNLGYGAAVNQAVRTVSTTYFYLLNPDIRLGSDFFAGLAEVMESDNIAAGGPLQFKVRDGKRVLNFCWSFWQVDCFKIYLLKHLFPGRTFTRPVRVGFLNAGCLLVRKSAFDTVGGFEPRYFLFGEEPDLFLKFKLHRYLCYLHPGVEVLHFREHSIGQLSGFAQFRLKLAAIRNIGDALIRGYWRILIDRLKRVDITPLYRH